MQKLILAILIASILTFLTKAMLNNNTYIKKFFKQKESAIKKYKYPAIFTIGQYLSILIITCIFATIYKISIPLLTNSQITNTLIFTLFITLTKSLPNYLNQLLKTNYPYQLLTLNFTFDILTNLLTTLTFILLIK